MTSYASKYLLPFRPLLILSYLTETHFPPSLLINCLDSLRAQMAFLLGSSCILTELTGLTRLTQPGITVNTQPTTPPPSHTDACSHRHIPKEVTFSYSSLYPQQLLLSLAQDNFYIRGWNNMGCNQSPLSVTSAVDHKSGCVFPDGLPLCSPSPSTSALNINTFNMAENSPPL